MANCVTSSVIRLCVPPPLFKVEELCAYEKGLNMFGGFFCLFFLKYPLKKIFRRPVMGPFKLKT